MYRHLRHRANPRFWQFYKKLPPDIQNLADECYKLLEKNPFHPSLHFKKVGRFRSVRVGKYYRAVAVQKVSDIVWFWIGRHDEYERLIGTKQAGS
jgi:mRNA-degrading endonuclease RelE of RelBE toxin-antitoxin system